MAGLMVGNTMVGYSAVTGDVWFFKVGDTVWLDNSKKIERDGWREKLLGVAEKNGLNKLFVDILRKEKGEPVGQMKTKMKSNKKQSFSAKKASGAKKVKKV